MRQDLRKKQSVEHSHVKEAQPVPYEVRLNAQPEWALMEGSRHFEGENAVQTSLRRVTARLEKLGIPYAVAGGMALFRHGYRRFTEDIDILVTPDGLKAIHESLVGLGYRPPYEGAKNLRDAETGVRIEFLIQGQYPGDGKPKPVAFPDPSVVSVELDGIRYLNLPTLVEMKLASGMSGAGRLKDLADVQELVKALGLPASFENELSNYVRGTFRELWVATEGEH